MRTTRPPRSRATVNWLVDGGLFIGFLVVMTPQGSGLPVHEWLGILFGGALVVHLLLHWSWMAEIGRRLIGALPAMTRINAALNLALFIDLTVVSVTGILISEAALPTLGLSVAGGSLWRGLHTATANLAILLTGLHIALHWQWITTTTRRIIGARTHHLAAPEAAEETHA